MKALKIAGLVVVVLMVAGIAVLFVGIPSGFVMSAIQERVERQTGFRVTIAGSTRLALWPSASVTANDVTIQDPNDRDLKNRLTIGSVRADLSLASLLSGQPQVTDVAIVRPQLNVPLLRERTRAVPQAKLAPGTSVVESETLAIGHVAITDGEIIFSNPRDRVEQRVIGVGADIKIGTDRQVKVTGSARVNERPIKFTLNAAAPAAAASRQTIPVELTLDAPELTTSTLAAKAEVRINGPVLMINGLSGTMGDAQFNGWASADLSSKPLVKLDLDFQRLDIGSRARKLKAADPRAVSQPWSDVPFDLQGLNYLDAQVRISAAELNIGDARFAPAAIDAVLSQGAMKATFANLGAYDGTASGEAIIDVSSGTPAMTLRTDLTGVRALPLLTGLADFDKLDGKLQAKIAVRAGGDNQRALMSSVTGTAFADFRDGAIRGINLARMIRALTSGTLTGWQDSPDQTTDLTQMSASFAIDKGIATTPDLALAGPLVRMNGGGTIDLSAKSLSLRVEPKLVMTTEGQGSAANPIGLGIPVVIEGPWAEPRIYPDMAGVLDDPDAAYAKLREMGKGLFGGDGKSNPLGGQLGETIGNLIQQGLGGSGRRNDMPAPGGDTRPNAPAGPSPIDSVLKQLFGR